MAEKKHFSLLWVASHRNLYELKVISQRSLIRFRCSIYMINVHRESKTHGTRLRPMSIATILIDFHNSLLVHSAENLLKKEN